MTGLDGEPDYSKMVHRVLSAPSYGKTTGDAPWRGRQPRASPYIKHTPTLCTVVLASSSIQGEVEGRSIRLLFRSNF